MWDPVDIDLPLGPVVAVGLRKGGNPVVGGPEDSGRIDQRVREHRHRDSQQGDRDDPTGAGEEHQEQHGHQQEPNKGRGARECADREADDADQRADQVVAVGVQSGQLGEAVGHQLAWASHDGGHREEDHRQRDPNRRSRGAQAGEVDHRFLVAIDRHRERRQEADVGQQCHH